jgi:hypothetical protein
MADTQRSMTDQVYILRYLLTHLREAQMWDDLCERLLDHEFGLAKISSAYPSARRSFDEYLYDFVRTLAVLPRHHPMRQQVYELLRGLDGAANLSRPAPGRGI